MAVIDPEHVISEEGEYRLLSHRLYMPFRLVQVDAIVSVSSLAASALCSLVSSVGGNIEMFGWL